MAVNVALEFQVMENPGMMDYQSVRGLRQWSTCLGMEVLRVVDDWTPPVLTSSPSLMKQSPKSTQSSGKCSDPIHSILPSPIGLTLSP
jgi:hypothetical protein